MVTCLQGTKPGERARAPGASTAHSLPVHLRAALSPRPVASTCSLHVPNSSASGMPGCPPTSAAWALVAVGQHTGAMQENSLWWWPEPPGSALHPGPPRPPRGNAEHGARSLRGEPAIRSPGLHPQTQAEPHTLFLFFTTRRLAKVTQSQDLGVVWSSLCGLQHGLPRKPLLVFRSTGPRPGLWGTHQGAAVPLLSVLSCWGRPAFPGPTHGSPASLPPRVGSWLL